MAKNECGECTVCCTLSVVEELNKGAGEDCKLCKNNGCSIYGKHPQVCKDFECAYLQGVADIELRPDKCGIMFFKKSDRIFTGALVPGVPVTNVAKGQIDAFNQQGYSVILLNLEEKKPLIKLANGHNEQEIFYEYLNLLKNGKI